MYTVVIIDAQKGSLDRYESGGSNYRKTHGCVCGEPVEFMSSVIESFRMCPDPKFAVELPSELSIIKKVT